MYYIAFSKKGFYFISWRSFAGREYTFYHRASVINMKSKKITNNINQSPPPSETSGFLIGFRCLYRLFTRFRGPEGCFLGGTSPLLGCRGWNPHTSFILLLIVALIVFRLQVMFLKVGYKKYHLERYAPGFALHRHNAASARRTDRKSIAKCGESEHEMPCGIRVVVLGFYIAVVKYAANPGQYFVFHAVHFGIRI